MENGFCDSTSRWSWEASSRDGARRRNHILPLLEGVDFWVVLLFFLIFLLFLLLFLEEEVAVGVELSMLVLKVEIP